MASLAGLRLGSKGSSLRALSLHPLACSSKPDSLFSFRRQLWQAPHFHLFTAARFSSSPSSPSSSSLPLSSSYAAAAAESAFQVSLSEELEVAEDDGAATSSSSSSSPPKARPLARKFSPLSPKEKKDLRAYAHSLGKKIVSQQVGKAGVTESLAKAISDTLEAKEILKLKVLDNCPDELNTVIAKIEEATQGQVVGKIGSVLTLYRPSLRKLSEAQKSQNKVQQGHQRTKGSIRRV